MTSAPPHRRATHHVGAVGVIIGLALSGCGVGSSGGGDTIPDPEGIPADHGLSDELVERVLESTVGVEGVACGKLASGSGFALTETLVVTNAHVILGIDEIRVHTTDGRELSAHPVAFDAVSDLAILEVDDADFRPLPLTDNAVPGSTGMVVGWEQDQVGEPAPYRVDKRVTVRIEEVAGTELVERPAWLVAADIDVGDSGAALVDRTGEVIGVAFAASTDEEETAYAVRSTAIDALVGIGIDPNLSVPPC